MRRSETQENGQFVADIEATWSTVHPPDGPGWSILTVECRSKWRIKVAMRRFFCCLCPLRDGESCDGELAGKESTPVQATLGFLNNSGSSVGGCSKAESTLTPDRRHGHTKLTLASTFDVDLPDHTVTVGFPDKSLSNKGGPLSKHITPETRIGTESKTSQFHENLI
jgi:hypothetical protein